MDTEARQAERQFHQNPNQENADVLLKHRARSGNSVKTLYPVVMPHYEYDDQYYSITDGQEVQQKVFVSKEAAETFLTETNRKAFLEMCESNLAQWSENYAFFPDGVSPDMQKMFQAAGINLTLTRGGWRQHDLFGNEILSSYRQGALSNAQLDAIGNASGLGYQGKIVELTLEDGICGAV